jgi:hypothetical protein
MSARFSSTIVADRHPDAEALNPGLTAAFERLTDADFERRTHFIDGRFENLYLKPERLPGLDAVLDYALGRVQALLCSARADWLPTSMGETQQPAQRRVPQALRIGFWINAMQPGQATSRHCHAEHDELCSGVYYVATPPSAGDILFHDPPFETRVQPQAGMLLLFSPELEHSVDVNRSDAQRLSLAFNVGPASPAPR